MAENNFTIMAAPSDLALLFAFICCQACYSFLYATLISTNTYRGARRFPASAFGDLYHRRWRIEEAFKRLNHRLHLEHVTGLSQQAVVQDVAAKIMCDNLQTLASLTAHEQAALREVDRINHAHAHTALKPLMPALLLGKKVAKQLREVLSLIAKQTYRHRENLSKPRKPKPKPHKHKSH